MVPRKVLFMLSSMPVSSFIGYTLTEYLKNLTIYDKFINKRVRPYKHQTMCREEKRISKS